MRIQHFVVLSFVLWLTLATGEAQFSHECFPTQTSAVIGPNRLPHTLALSEAGRTIGFWATLSVTAVGVVCILCWLPRGASGWDNVMRHFPDVPVAPGGRVKQRGEVAIGGFRFENCVTLKFTPMGVHIRPQGLLTPQVFIPYSAMKRIVAYRASNAAKLTRVLLEVQGVTLRDSYGLIVDYPAEFEIALSIEDFEFVKPFLTAIPIEEYAGTVWAAS